MNYDDANRPIIWQPLLYMKMQLNFILFGQNGLYRIGRIQFGVVEGLRHVVEGLPHVHYQMYMKDFSVC
jgi:hypothetical protein